MLCFYSLNINQILRAGGTLPLHKQTYDARNVGALSEHPCFFRQYINASHSLYHIVKAKAIFDLHIIQKGTLLKAPLSYAFYLPLGTLAMILPAKSLKFWVWRIIFPGPVSFVRKSPSPPRKMFPRPFTVSMS